jgi:hypothetical protein
LIFLQSMKHNYWTIIVHYLLLSMLNFRSNFCAEGRNTDIVGSNFLEKNCVIKRSNNYDTSYLWKFYRIYQAISSFGKNSNQNTGSHNVRYVQISSKCIIIIGYYCFTPIQLIAFSDSGPVSRDKIKAFRNALYRDDPFGLPPEYLIYDQRRIWNLRGI